MSGIILKAFQPEMRLGHASCNLTTSTKKQIKVIKCDRGKPPFVVSFKSQTTVDTPLEAVLLPIRQIYLDLLGFAF